MGQKTNPKGFRLVTTQKHLSDWYSTEKEYSTLLEEDFLIRSKVNEFFNDFLSISKVEINRIQQDSDQKEYVNITIHALFPRAKEMSRKVNKFFSETDKESSQKTLTLLNSSKGTLKRFTSLLLNRTIRKLIRYFQLKTNKNYYVGIKFIRNPFEDTMLIAKFIADQLERRVPFRRAIKQTIKKVQLTQMKGLKVQLSGRLNGIEIARSEWKREGKIPLHTLRANIDYTHYEAETIYGLIGIKVWLFVN